MATPGTGTPQLTDEDLDALAWRFLHSEYAGKSYFEWPLDRRLAAYLAHHGLIGIADDGAAYAAVLDRVMDTIGRARRSGVLPSSDSR